MADLVSTVPAVYDALLGLVHAAAAAQNPQPGVFAFELGEFEPGSYITVHAIENHQWSPESMGSFSQEEHYDICGTATVFTGSSPNTDPTVATSILVATYTLFQACVMTPLMSNRTMPILGATPSPYQMLPGYTRYTAGVGTVGDRPSGWFGLLEWSFHFDAYITPA